MHSGKRGVLKQGGSKNRYRAQEGVFSVLLTAIALTAVEECPIFIRERILALARCIPVAERHLHRVVVFRRPTGCAATP
jgi:hypothetical protein